MNCYGTNPMLTQSTSQNSAIPQSGMQPAQTGMSAVPSNTVMYDTVTSGEWSQPIPVNPNMPTSPASIWPGVPPSELPIVLTSPIYTPGYLMLHIGDLMRVEFLIGNSMTDRVGRLKQVGASFIALAALDGGSEIVCDLYSIRFVTLIQNDVAGRLLGAY